MNRHMSVFVRSLTAVLSLWWGLSATVCQAVPVSVSLDTASISGGSFSIAFDFFDGDAAAHNTVTIDGFDFGGGSPTGSPILTGGATGNLSSVVTLSDSGGFFNSLVQGFIPGSILSFVIETTTNFAGGTPDSLVFSLLDSTGAPLPTTDPLGTDALLVIALGSGGPVTETFSSPAFNIPVPQAAVAPEPGTLVLLGGGLGGLIVAQLRRKALSEA